MEIQARAKINWTLNVVGKRPDGYHLLDMLMQPLALHDTLIIEPSDDLSLRIEGTECLSAGDDNLILLQPCAALSTKEVFSAYHASPAIIPADNEKSMQALASGDLSALRQCAGNALESASIPLRPQIRQAKEALYASGAAFAQMTGSGSVVFGAFENPSRARKAFEELKIYYQPCILTETAN